MGTKSNTDNRANQLNPNNGAYWKTRGASSPTHTSEWKAPEPTKPNNTGGKAR